MHTILGSLRFFQQVYQHAFLHPNTMTLGETPIDHTIHPNGLPALPSIPSSSNDFLMDNLLHNFYFYGNTEFNAILAELQVYWTKVASLEVRLVELCQTSVVTHQLKHLKNILI
jgi:hypothetical protein